MLDETRHRVGDRVQHRRGRRRGGGGKLIGYDEREVPFDLAVVIPVHSGADVRRRSPGLGDDLDFVPTDEHTLQSKAKPNVFAIGDAANLPISKAGSVTHFEGEVLVENIVRFLRGEPLDAVYDGHANCFIETGFHKAMLIDFNYETRAGRRPLPRPGRRAAAQGVAAQPPRQADVPVVLLARPACRVATSRASPPTCPPPASTSRSSSAELRRSDSCPPQRSPVSTSW